MFTEKMSTYNLEVESHTTNAGASTDSRQPIENPTKEIARIPIEYLEHVGEVRERELPPCDPFSAAGPFSLDIDLFKELEDKP